MRNEQNSSQHINFIGKLEEDNSATIIIIIIIIIIFIAEKQQEARIFSLDSLTITE